VNKIIWSDNYKMFAWLLTTLIAISFSQIASFKMPALLMTISIFLNASIVFLKASRKTFFSRLSKLNYYCCQFYIFQKDEIPTYLHNSSYLLHLFERRQLCWVQTHSEFLPQLFAHNPY
jgi:hypothetical protein